eukprot:2053849-Rhodomonas_salina.1
MLLSVIGYVATRIAIPLAGSRAPGLSRPVAGQVQRRCAAAAHRGVSHVEHHVRVRPGPGPQAPNRREGTCGRPIRASASFCGTAMQCGVQADAYLLDHSGLTYALRLLTHASLTG